MVRKPKEIKRIVYFLESGGAGGAEKVVVTLAKEAVLQGFEVLVVTLREGWFTEQLDQNNISRLLLKSEKSLDFSLIFKLRNALKKFRADLIHTHSVDSGFYGAIAASLAKVKHISTEHGEVHHTHKKKFQVLKYKIQNLLGSNFTAVSNYSKKALSEIIPNAQIKVIYNPLSPFDENLDTGSPYLNRGLSKDTFIWINLANLRPVKDQETLIKAFSHALKENENQALFIVGEGECRAKLEQQIKELKLEDKVFLVGYTSNVVPYLKYAHGFVLSSKSEAFPMSILEAASFGLIIVTTKVGGIPEVLNEKNAFLVEVGDVEGLGKKMCLALIHSSRLKFKDSLIEELRNRFDSGKILENLYRVVN